MSEPPADARLLVELLDGGILVTTPAEADPNRQVEAGSGIATLLQPDGDVVTLLAGPAGAHGPAALARHAAAVRRTTRAVRATARRLRRRSRLAGLAATLLVGGGIAGPVVAFGRALEPAVWGWLGSVGALAGLVCLAAAFWPLLGRIALRRGRTRRIAAANRAWLADHGFQIGAHGLSSRASSRRA